MPLRHFVTLSCDNNRLSLANNKELIQTPVHKFRSNLQEEKEEEEEEEDTFEGGDSKKQMPADRVIHQAQRNASDVPEFSVQNLKASMKGLKRGGQRTATFTAKVITCKTICERKSLLNGFCEHGQEVNCQVQHDDDSEDEEETHCKVIMECIATTTGPPHDLNGKRARVGVLQSQKRNLIHIE